MAAPDLLVRTAALVDIPSVSHEEAAIVDHIEATLRALPHLTASRSSSPRKGRMDGTGVGGLRPRLGRLEGCGGARAAARRPYSFWFRRPSCDPARLLCGGVR